MQPERKFKTIEATEVSFLLTKHYSTLMKSFYDLQSSWMSRIYRKYKNIETANIICCFSRNTHLEIIRLKEYNLNHDVSLNNFWVNFFKISKPVEKIASLVNETAIPKETVRRKLKNLVNEKNVKLLLPQHWVRTACRRACRICTWTMRRLHKIPVAPLTINQGELCNFRRR